MKTQLTYNGKTQNCTVVSRYMGRPETSEHSFRASRGPLLDYVQVLWGDAPWTTSNYSTEHLLAKDLTGELPAVGYDNAEIQKAVFVANQKNLWGNGMTAAEVLAL